MDLFERYFHAVRSFLPKRQQDDVVRELSEELRSQAEEQEAQLGRPLTQAEQEQMLKQWGHPLILASRYQPQRQLVGPAAFPIYWLVLRVALGVTLLVHVISAAIFLASGQPPGDVIEHLMRLTPFLMAFAWVTLVFAVLDRTVLRLPFFADWNPASLPTVPQQSSGSLWCRLAEIAVTVVFLLWLAAAPRNQWLIFGPAWTLIQLGPAWFSVHLAMIALVCASLVVMVLSLRHPERHTLRSTTRVMTNVGSLALMVYLMKADDLVIPAAAASAGAEGLARLLNTIGRIGMAVAMLLVLAETVRETLRLFNRRRLPGNWSPRPS